MGRSTTESGRCGMPQRNQDHGKLPDGLVEAGLVREPAHDGVGAAEAVQALGGEVSGHDLEARHRPAGEGDADDAVHIGAAVGEIGDLVFGGRNGFDRQHRAVGARVALHAHGAHRKNPAFVDSLGFRSASVHRQRIARPGPGKRMAVQ